MSTIPAEMRYAVPRTHRTLVLRRRPLQSLRDWRNRRVITVIAPAGYGKTTLISEWLQTMPEDDRPPIAWWGLQAADDDPEIFLRGLLESMRSAVDAPAAIDDLIAAAAAGRILPRQIVQMLSTQLNGRSPVLLVLDDVHLLTSPEIHQFIEALIDSGPRALHFVFLSRTPLAFPLGRQRLSGTLLELGVHDLAFDHGEFLEFARSVSLSRCSAELLADIEKRSDGWIAGLQMFAIAGEQGAPMLAAGTFVPEFLQHEILRRLPPDLLALLMRSAVLPWLDAASLAAVLELPHHAAEELLQRILRTELLLQMFVSPTQPSSLSLRLHPLLRDHLLEILERSVSTEEVRNIRERAARVIAADGDVDAALALLAGEQAAMAQLLARHTRDALRRNERVALRRWLRGISEDALSAEPQVALDAAWLSYMTEAGDQRESLALAQRAVRHASHAPTELVDEWSAELYVLEGLLTVFANRPDDAVAVFHRATDIPHSPDGLAEAFRLELSVHLPLSMSPQDKDAAMRRSGEIFRKIGFAAQSIESMIIRALLLWQQSDVPRALLVVQEAAAVAELEMLELSPSTAYLHYIRGEMLYYLDRIPEARQSLLRSLQISRSIGELQSMDYWSHTMLQLCDHAESIPPVFDEEFEMRMWVDGSRRFMPLIGARNAWLRIRRDAALGRLDHIEAAWRSIGVSPAQLRPEMNENVWFAVLNGALYSNEDPETVESSLCTLIEFLDRRERRWAAVHARTLLALLYARIGRIADARAQIAHLLPILEHNRCSRSLLEYPELIPLIAMENSLFAQSMLQCVRPAVSPDVHPYNLSDREIDILRLLVSGRGTKEISRSMHIAITTLRAHTNNIYHKLGVHSRAEAVRVARAVGLGEDSLL